MIIIMVVELFVKCKLARSIPVLTSSNSIQLLSSMKRIIVLIAIALTSCVVQKNRITMEFAKNPVVAHRGARKSKNLPENSNTSLRHAIAIGCTDSEFDVRTTADDSLIINHNPHYNKLEIDKVSYAELSQSKLSNGEILPTLRQYL